MISKFSDLASNERTYLSWIRTAIAIMAFGFLIEKFELFFQIIKKETHYTVPGHLKNINLSKGVELIGLSMMFMAVIIIFASTVRFAKQRKYILRKNEEQAYSTGFAAALASLLILIALLLIAYLFIRIIY